MAELSSETLDTAQNIGSGSHDIVQQIKDLYMRKKPVGEKIEALVPTKATLFGLDIRFKEVDEKSQQDKLRRTAFKKQSKKNDRVGSRHAPPLKGQYLHHEALKTPTLDQLGMIANEHRDGIDGVVFQPCSLEEIQARKSKPADKQAYRSTESRESNKVLAILTRKKQKKQELLNVGNLNQQDTHLGRDDSTPHSGKNLNNQQTFKGASSRSIAPGSNELRQSFHTQLKSTQTTDLAQARSQAQNYKSVQSFSSKPSHKHDAEQFNIYKVQLNTCYDDVVQRNLNTGLPKGLSYVTDAMLEGKKEPSQADRERAHQKMLQMTEKDALFKQLQRQLQELNKQQKKRAPEKSLQTRKVAIQQPGFIKRARLFENEQTREAIDTIMKQIKIVKGGDDEFDMWYKAIVEKNNAKSNANEQSKQQTREEGRRQEKQRQTQLEEAKKRKSFRARNMIPSETDIKEFYDAFKQNDTSVQEETMLNDLDNQALMDYFTIKEKGDDIQIYAQENKFLPSNAQQINEYDQHFVQLEVEDKKKKKKIKLPVTSQEPVGEKFDYYLNNKGMLVIKKLNMPPIARQSKSSQMGARRSKFGSPGSKVGFNIKQDSRKSLNASRVNFKAGKQLTQDISKAQMSEIFGKPNLEKHKTNPKGLIEGNYAVDEGESSMTQTQTSLNDLPNEQSSLGRKYNDQEDATQLTLPRTLQRHASGCDKCHLPGEGTKMGQCCTTSCAEIVISGQRRQSNQGKLIKDTKGSIKRRRDGKSRSEEEQSNTPLRKVKQPGFNLNYTKDNLVTKIEFETNQLNVLEKEKLRERQQAQQLKYKAIAANRFNSAKNRSIMIQDQHNNVRNDVMRKIFSRQLHKRRRDSFNNEAKIRIKEETRLAEEQAAVREAAEKKERELQMQGSNKDASTAADSLFDLSLFDGKHAEKDPKRMSLFAQAKRENLNETDLYDLVRKQQPERLRPEELKFLTAFQQKKYMKIQNDKLSSLKQDDLDFLVQFEFLDHVKSIVTKQSSKPVQTTNNARQESTNRRKLLNQINPAEIDDDREVGIEDIAGYIKKEIQKGWITTQIRR